MCTPKEIINEFDYYLAEHIFNNMDKFTDNEGYSSKEDLAKTIQEFRSKWNLHVYERDVV